MQILQKKKATFIINDIEISFNEKVTAMITIMTLIAECFANFILTQRCHF